MTGREIILHSKNIAIPDILSPTDDRIFKLILSHPDAKPALIELLTAITDLDIKEVIVRNNELPATDVLEKQERLDINCTVDDGTQVDIEMHASRTHERILGSHRNLISKSIYYLADLHSTQSSKGKPYDALAKTMQVTFCTYTVFDKTREFTNTFFLRNAYGDVLSEDISLVFLNYRSSTK